VPQWERRSANVADLSVTYVLSSAVHNMGSHGESWMRNFLMQLILVAVLLAQTLPAAPFSRIYTYGDSLSHPAFSNGPVAVDYLADHLGIAPADRFNFATGGATTGIGNYLTGGSVTTASPGGGLFTQLNNSLAAGINPADALFVVWGGPNDFLAPSPLDFTTEAIIGRAITNLVTIVMTLQTAGAQHILVPGLPMLGLTPFYNSDPITSAQANAVALGFNAALQANLPREAIFFDTAAFMQRVVQNPGAYGLTNVTGQCIAGMTICPNPDEYLFLNDFHPTTAAHRILANEFAAAIPEPGSIVLVLAGFGAFAVSRRIRGLVGRR
jgi:cholinesterase